MGLLRKEDVSMSDVSDMFGHSLRIICLLLFLVPLLQIVCYCLKIDITAIYDYRYHLKHECLLWSEPLQLLSSVPW